MVGADVQQMRAWPLRRWAVAAAGAVATVVVIGVPTDLIDTPLFGRMVPPTWWSWPALLATALMAGLLLATYVRPVAPPGGAVSVSVSARDGGDAVAALRSRGTLGGALAFFAVGCPVCNKVVLLALGSSGAMTWFAPVQPLLAVAGPAVLAVALHQRLAGERACRIAVEPAGEVVG